MNITLSFIAQNSMRALSFVCACTLLSPALAESSVAPAGGEPRYFTVTAYYSPLPGQNRYLRGNYHDEIILNGKGTNGADGTEVYPGMLAAPYTYSFGTKIFLPGMGVGTVHDRGGAIVSAGNRGYAHDRIDVWMGHGDEGLARALAWGKRTVLGALYPKTAAVVENFSYMGNWSPGTTRTYVAQTTAKKGLKNTATLRLQKNLADLDYFSDPITGYFGDETEEAILDFQLENGVISSAQEDGAGVFGPQTQKTLYALLSQRESKKKEETEYFSELYPMGISKGDEGKYVLRIQKFLDELGYFSGEFSTEFTEETEAAVLAFQLEHDVISSENEGGAGVFGPKTQSAMFDLLFERQQVLKKEKADLFSAANFGGEKKEKQKNIAQEKNIEELPEKIDPKIIAKEFDKNQIQGPAVASSTHQERAVMSMTFEGN